MPPSSPPQAQLAIWNSGLDGLRGKLDNLVGTGHAGLDVYGICNHVYITWAPAGGVTCLQQALPLTTQATQQLGFEHIRDKRTGQIKPNDRYVNKQILEQDPARLRNQQGQVLLPPAHRGPLTRAQEVGNFGNAPPDWDIAIAGADLLDARADGPAWGLQCDVMCRWWIRMLKLPPDSPQRRFNFHAKMHDTAKNCCATVAKALSIGGLASYAPPPKNVWYQGINTLRRWAEQANKRIWFLNDQRKILMQSEEWRHVNIYVGPQPFDFMGACELPTLDEWKQMSRVRSSFRTGLARRHDQIAEIDRLLPLYHAARRQAQVENPADDENYFEDTEDLLSDSKSWLSYMALIQEQCYFHLTQKPRSDRRLAVVQLAKLINLALRGNTRFHQDRLRRENAPNEATYQQSIQAARDAMESSLIMQHPELIETGSYQNVDRNGQMKWDASGSYEVPPDALASGRYENLTDSLRHLDSGSYAMPPERSLGSSFSQSGSGEYDFPTELDKHPFRARFGRQAQSLPRRLPRPANPQPPARALPRGRTL